MKHDKPNEFDLARAVVRRPSDEVARDMSAERSRVASTIARAAPPEHMQAAPVAPARGAMQLVANWQLLPGGTRRQEGSHWRSVCSLTAMNAHAAARAKSREVECVLPFGPGHVSIAAIYRALAEWREGSGIKLSSMEAGRGGSGSGVFIDRFIDEGARLKSLHLAIGDGWAMRPQRAMDRGNARRPISVRAAVDLVVLGGQDLTAVLKRFGWEADGKNRKALRLAICAALDRMQGYRDAPGKNPA